MSDHALSAPSPVARGRRHWPGWARAGTAMLCVAGVAGFGAWAVWPRPAVDRSTGATGSTWGLGRPLPERSAAAPASLAAPVLDPVRTQVEPEPSSSLAPPIAAALATPMGFWEAQGAGGGHAGAAPSATPVAASLEDTPASGSEYAQRMQTTTFGNVTPRPVRLHAQYTLKKGTVFDCTPAQPISSAMVGPVQCHTTDNVWSMDGSTILLPAGTEVNGTIERGLSVGERRLFVVWTDALTPKPDLLSIPLQAPAADEMGQVGLPGDVNDHLWQRLKATLLLSGVEFLTGVGTAAVQDGARQVFNFGGAGNIGRSGSSLAEMAFARDMNIPTTLERGPARTLKVYVNRNIDLVHYYRNVVR